MCIKLTNFRLPMFLSGPHHAEPDGCLRFAVSDVYKVTNEMCYDDLYQQGLCTVQNIGIHSSSALLCITGVQHWQAWMCKPEEHTCAKSTLKSFCPQCCKACGLVVDLALSPSPVQAPMVPQGQLLREHLDLQIQSSTTLSNS